MDVAISSSSSLSQARDPGPHVPAPLNACDVGKQLQICALYFAMQAMKILASTATTARLLGISKACLQSPICFELPIYPILLPKLMRQVQFMISGWGPMICRLRKAAYAWQDLQSPHSCNGAPYAPSIVLEMRGILERPHFHDIRTQYADLLQDAVIPCET